MFGRAPEQEGFDYWMDGYTSGDWSLTRMATFFAASDEFNRTYGDLDNLGFVRQLYLNVLDRPGEAKGVEFWTGRADNGWTRGQLLLQFSESPENVTRSGTVAPILGDFNVGRSGPWTCGIDPNPQVDHTNTDIHNCSDFSTQAEAQQHYFDVLAVTGVDSDQLDGDGDGVVCVSLP